MDRRWAPGSEGPLLLHITRTSLQYVRNFLLTSSNLATYASLFGMAWLEPIMWKLQQWLYSKYALLHHLSPCPDSKADMQDTHHALPISIYRPDAYRPTIQRRPTLAPGRGLVAVRPIQAE